MILGSIPDRHRLPALQASFEPPPAPQQRQFFVSRFGGELLPDLTVLRRSLSASLASTL